MEKQEKGLLYNLVMKRPKEILGFFVFVVIFCFIPLFVHSSYYLHLLIKVAMDAILAMTFILMLRVGLISLAIAAFWSIGAYASTLLVMELNLSFWLALPSATIITGIIALGIGYILVRNTGFSFLILTSVFGMIIVLIYGNIPQVGGYQGIEAIPPPDSILFPFLGPIEFMSKIPYYYLILSLMVLVVLLFAALYGSWIGRAWRSTALSPQLAESIGVDLFKYRLLAFVIASAAAGLVGSYYAHYLGAVTPPTFNIFKTITIHIYAILGGREFAILGPLVGSLIMTFVPEFFRITKEVEPIFSGCLMIFLILFLPKGVLSLFTRKRKNTFRI